MSNIIFCYIWSFEHRAFWRPHSMEDATRICLNANQFGVNEAIVPMTEIAALQRTPI